MLCPNCGKEHIGYKCPNCDYDHSNSNNYNNDFFKEDSNNEKVNYCGYCGHKLNQDSKFCPYCGKNLKPFDDNNYKNNQYNNFYNFNNTANNDFNQVTYNYQNNKNNDNKRKLLVPCILIILACIMTIFSFISTFYSVFNIINKNTVSYSSNFTFPEYDEYIPPEFNVPEEKDYTSVYPNGVSIEEFKKLSIGMDYSQVSYIIGGDGIITSTQDNTVIVTWPSEYNIENSYIEVTFTDGKVSNIEDFNLF